MIDPRSSRFLRAAVVIAVAGAIASCTLFGSRDINQCESDAECSVNARPGAPSNARIACVDHLCSPRPSADAGPDVVEAGSDGPIPCGAGCPVDPPNVCVDGTCVELLSEECPRLPNSERYRNVYQQDGALLVGVYVFQPLSAGAEVRTIEAAIKDINDQLPPQTRIAALFCEKKSKLAQGNAQAAVDHLASRRVPLVLGQFEASELKDLKSQGLTVWSTLGNGPAVAQGRTEYRFLVDQLEKLAPGFGPALDDALARARVVHDDPSLVPVVRMVVSDREEHRLLAGALEASAFPLLDAGGGSDYARIAPELQSDFETPLPDNTNAQKNLVQATPHIIIALGGDEVGTLITKVEATVGTNVWPPGTPRPIWVVGTRTKFNANALVAVTAVPTSPLRGRLIGVDFGGDQAKLSKLLDTLTGVKHAGSQDHLYDAMFAATFAAMRAQVNRGTTGGPYTAVELVRGLDEVLQPPGTPDAIPVDGALNLTGAVAGVQQGKAVHFIGTTGPWTFPAPRVSRGNMGISYFCFAPAAQGGLKYYVAADALNNGASCAPATPPP